MQVHDIPGKPDYLVWDTPQPVEYAITTTHIFWAVWGAT